MPQQLARMLQAAARPSREQQRLRGRDKNARSGARTAARPAGDDNLDVATEPIQKMEQALDREAVEPIIVEGRDFGLTDAELAGGSKLGETARGKELIDGDGEAYLGLLFTGVAEAEIPEDVTRALKSALFWHSEPRSRVVQRATAVRSAEYPRDWCARH